MHCSMDIKEHVRIDMDNSDNDDLGEYRDNKQVPIQGEGILMLLLLKHCLKAELTDLLDM